VTNVKKHKSITLTFNVPDIAIRSDVEFLKNEREGGNRQPSHTSERVHVIATGRFVSIRFSCCIFFCCWCIFFFCCFWFGSVGDDSGNGSVRFVGFFLRSIGRRSFVDDDGFLGCWSFNRNLWFFIYRVGIGNFRFFFTSRKDLCNEPLPYGFMRNL